MTKVCLEYTLKNNEKTLKKKIVGIKNENNIIFKDNDTFHLSKNIFLKENEDSIFKIDLLNKRCTYYLKKYQKTFNLDIKIIKYTYNDYYLKYEIENNTVEFSLTYEVVT